MNASVSGYGTDQEYLYLKTSGIRFKPLFKLENGVLRLTNVPVPQSTIRQQVTRLALGRSYLGLRLFTAGGKIRRLLLGKKMSEDGNEQEFQSDSPMCRVTSSLIVAMNGLCEENQARLLIVSVPMSETRRKILEKVTTDSHIPYVKLDGYFDSGERDVTFLHDEHWSKRGHEVAAHAIESFLLDEKIFEKDSLAN